MNLQGIKNELKALKKELAPNHKTIEELQRMDINTLSDEELYRLIAGGNPAKPLSEVTDGELEAMINGA